MPNLTAFLVYTVGWWSIRHKGLCPQSPSFIESGGWVNVLLRLAKPTSVYLLLTVFLSVNPCLTITTVTAHSKESSTTKKHASTATYQQHHTDRKDQVHTFVAGVKQARQLTVGQKTWQSTSPPRFTLTLAELKAKHLRPNHQENYSRILFAVSRAETRKLNRPEILQVSCCARMQRLHPPQVKQSVSVWEDYSHMLLPTFPPCVSRTPFRQLSLTSQRVHSQSQGCVGALHSAHRKGTPHIIVWFYLLPS